MKRALRVVITLGLLGGVLWWIGDEEQSGVEKIYQVFSGAHWGFVALVFLISTIDRVLMTFKWKLLLASRGLHLGFLRGVNVYCTSMVWGLFLPSTVGADALRASMTIRQGLRSNDVVASIVVERMVGFLCSLVSSLLGLVLLARLTDLPAPWDSLWWIGSLVLLGGIAMVALSFSRVAFARVLGLIPAPLRTNWLVETLERLHETYVDYVSEGRSIAVFALLTFLEVFVSILMSWVSALALNVDVGLLFVAGALPLSILVSRLPLSIDGIGVFEGAFAALMLLAGVSEQEAISVALMGRFVQIASWLPWWFSHMWLTREIRPPESRVADGDGAGAPS